MFLNHSDTPYDLHFRLFGTRVTVHVSFWIFSAILGWNYINAGFAFLLMWIACTFVSILLHEFGHVWAGRAFGSNGNILLYSMGGLAIGASDQEVRWQRVLVYLAGPAIQLALFGALWVLARYIIQEQLRDWPPLAIAAFAMLVQINLIWALFNLLPVWPLDGGQVCREFCEKLAARNGTRISLMISIGVGGFLAINTLLAINDKPYVPYLAGGGFYTVILFAILALESFMLLKSLRRDSWRDSADPWDLK